MIHRFTGLRAPLIGAALVGAGLLPAAAVAADITQLLGRCVACHGADGIGKAPQYPNLRGQKAPYLEKSLKAFRSGERKDPNMSAMARDLTDADIAMLATFFQNLE